MIRTRSIVTLVISGASLLLFTVDWRAALALGVVGIVLSVLNLRSAR